MSALIGAEEVGAKWAYKSCTSFWSFFASKSWSAQWSGGGLLPEAGRCFELQQNMGSKQANPAADGMTGKNEEVPTFLIKEQTGPVVLIWKFSARYPEGFPLRSGPSGQHDGLLPKSSVQNG